MGLWPPFSLPAADHLTCSMILIRIDKIAVTVDFFRMFGLGRNLSPSGASLKNVKIFHRCEPILKRQGESRLSRLVPREQASRHEPAIDALS
jgi:hypothetical protein